jgi:hypothetical protein
MEGESSGVNHKILYQINKRKSESVRAACFIGSKLKCHCPE